MKKLLLLSLFISSFIFSQAQTPPANDACSGAIDLGTLPADEGCGGNGANAGTGAATGSVTATGTNVDATAEAPYSTIVSCYTGNDMASPAADVWYSFTASSYTVDVSITGLANPNVGLYMGADCDNLTPWGCGEGTGAQTFTFEQITIGETYWLQISGGDMNDQAQFDLEVSNYRDCDDCIIESAVSVNPLPVNGVYEPNTTVTFCYAVNGYIQQNTNWFHGIEPILGPGWDPNSINPVSVPATQCNTGGTWAWFPGGITSSANGATAGAGFYFDADGDGDPGNNFGDGGSDACSEAGTWEFCFEVTTVGCSPGQNNIDLTIEILNFGDGEVGSWTNIGCSDDPPFDMSAALACCDFPLLDQTNITCFGLNNGTATVTGQGTAPYDYVWTNAADNSTVYTDNNNNGASTATDLAPGDYLVSVTDDNGCEQIIGVTITEPEQIILSEVHTNESCFGFCDGTGTVSVDAGGTAPFTYDWNGVGNTPNAASNTGLCEGTHTVTITDANGCEETIDVVITAPAQIVLSEVHTDVTCFEACDGTGTVTVNSGGTAPFSYDWAGAGNTPTAASNTGLCAGTHTVTITDANGCTETIDVVITEPDQMVLSEVHTDVLCNGDCTGTGTVTVDAGGTAPFSYDWGGAGDTPASDSNTGLCAGTYTVTVTDANGCEETIDVVVSEPALLTLSEIHNDASCFGECDGDATILAGGNGPFTYDWGGAGNTPTALTNTGLCAGTYTVTVTDANGCTETIDVVITEPAEIVVSTSNTPSSCGASDGSVTVTATGGTGGFTYAWVDGSGTPVGATATVTGLAAGTYTVTVTDGPCEEIITATISDQGGPTMTLGVTTDVSCNGACDGTVNITVAGGAAPLTYTWPAGMTVAADNLSASDICAGTYTVTVTDANGCSSNVDFTINEPEILAITETHVDNLCNGDCTGSIDATITGGTAPYTYVWNNGTTTEDLTGLCAGDYTLDVTDANGCTETISVTITEPDALTLSIVGTDSSAPGANNGSADATITGGTAPLSYLWDNGATTEDITGLAPGTYCLTVTDANGCEITECVAIAEPSDIDITLVGTNMSCFGTCDGTATLTINTPGNFNITWTQTGGTVAGDDMSVSDLCAQTVTVLVEDIDNGTTATAFVNIIEPDQILLDETHTEALCNGSCDGTAEVSITSGGVAPFTYDWAGAGDTPTSNTNTSLCAGTYTVTVTDANGCSNTIDVTIGEPQAIVISETHVNIDCNGNCNGSIDVTVTGGTAPFTFDWSNGETTEDISGLCADTYTLNVLDANGCTEIISIEITEPTAIVLDASETPANCGQPDGSATVTATGGTAPYTYQWDDALFQTTATATGLVPGTYCCTVTDANGCQETICIDVTNIASGSLSLDNTTNVSCFGLCDGSATVSITGGIAPFVWSLNGNAVTDGNFTGLCAGDYSVVVIDDVGCAMTIDFTITEPEELLVSETHTDASCFGLCDGTGTITPTGGAAPFTYDWNGVGNAPTSDINDGLCAGTHTVTITDANGCTTAIDVTITEPSQLQLATTSFDLTCFESCDGQVIVIPSGGTNNVGGYTIEWTDGGNNFVSSEASVSDLCVGDYTVTVTDDNGCTETATETITQPEAIIIELNQTPANCGQADGEATVTGTGGVAPLTYIWDNGSNGQSTGPVTPGTYCVTVTDANGCSVTECIEVENIPGPVASVFLETNASCFQSCDGQMVISVDVGNSNNLSFAYSFDGGTPVQTNNPITGLCAGTYDIIVADDLGCISTTQGIIGEPTPVTVEAFGDTTICIDGCAELSAQASGGFGPYSYDWGADGNTQIINVCPDAAGQYSVTATDANGCPSFPATVNVGINPPLSLDLTTIGDAFVCPGEEVTIDATPSGGSGNGYVITWDPLPDNGQSPQDPPVVYTPNGDMTITATVSDNCETPDATSTIDIGNHIIPEINFSADYYNGCQPLTVTFSPDITPTPVIYDWNFGDNNSVGNTSLESNPSHTYEDPGVYDVSLVITTAEGCIDSLTQDQMIEVYENPIASFEFGPQPTTILSPFVDFDGSSSHLANQYDWFMNDSISPWASGIETDYTFNDHGTYQVTLLVTSPDGCIDTTTQTVIIDPDYTLFVPTAFSPNGDGLNDQFKPLGIGIDEENYDFWIYDRWGNMIFHTDDYQMAWDGRVHECLTCPALNTRTTAQIDVYVWKVVTIQDGRTVKKEGIVTLLR